MCGMHGVGVVWVLVLPCRLTLPLFSSQCPNASLNSTLSGFAFIASLKIGAAWLSRCKRNNSKCAWTYVASISVHRLNIRIASLVRFFFLCWYGELEWDTWKNEQQRNYIVRWNNVETNQVYVGQWHENADDKISLPCSQSLHFLCYVRVCVCVMMLHHLNTRCRRGKM